MPPCRGLTLSLTLPLPLTLPNPNPDLRAAAGRARLVLLHHRTARRRDLGEAPQRDAVAPHLHRVKELVLSLTQTLTLSLALARIRALTLTRTRTLRTDSRLGRHELSGANISSAHQRQPGPVASRQRLCGSTPSAFMHIVSVPSAQYVGSSCVVNCSDSGKNGSISLLCIACAGEEAGGGERSENGAVPGKAGGCAQRAPA